MLRVLMRKRGAVVGSWRKAGNPLGIVGGLVGSVVGGTVYYCKGVVMMEEEIGRSGLVRCLSLWLVSWKEEHNRMRGLSLFIYTRRRCRAEGV